MAKIRVYELARDLGIESKVLLAKMKELNIDVPSHQSTLAPAQIDKIRLAFVAGKPKVVVRRRKKEEEEQPQIQEDVPDLVHAIEAPEESKQDVEDKVEDSSETLVASEEEATEDVQPIVSSVEETLEPEVAAAPEVDDLTLAPEKEIEKETAPALEETSAISVELPSVENTQAESENEKPSLPEEEKSTMKADKMGLSKKSEFVSATIIRRATPEEEVALAKSKEEKKVKIKRIEVQSIRTTIGPSIVGSQSVTPKDWKEPFKIAPEPSLKTDRGLERKKDAPRPARFGEEEERPAVKPVTALPKRRSVSTRELLEAVVRDDDEVDAAAAARRKTIYTPSSNRNKKKDVKRRKDLKSTQLTTPRAAYRIVKMTSPNISVTEMASQMHIKVNELVRKFMDQGLAVTANQSVDFDTAALIAGDFGFEVKRITRTVEDVLGWDKEEQYEKVSRPPIVTVMGHVDHGKTTILDAIRKADVANREAGGITQHIGAYTVERNGLKTAFLDTPGHAAFSAMRQRGAQVTDIVVLVVAADDGVMPQTIEAISHAKKAGVPIVVAINKIDKPNLNFDRIYTELSEQGIQTEAWGGDVQCVKVSAKKMLGIDELLDAIHLQCEILELKARVEGRARGVVVEAHLDKGRGSIATIMVTDGTLKVGEFIVVGKVFGRVRAMIDHNAKDLKKATPSTPIGVIGLTELPMAGDVMHVVKDEKAAREVIALRINEEREAALAAKVPATLEELLSRSTVSQSPDLALMIKADTQGSAEAISHAISELKSKMVSTSIIYKGVGDITESDISLAETSKAVLIAFNVKISRALTDLALTKGVQTKQFNIIYELIDTVKDLMVRKLPPICNELLQGHAEVRNTISVPKIGLIAGSGVTDGKVTRNSLVRVLRKGDAIFSGKVSSLKRFKDDVKEVVTGFECGIAIDGFRDFEIGDVIESYTIEEKPAVLDI